MLKAYLGQARTCHALGDVGESKSHFEKAAELYRTKHGFDFNWIWEGCDAQVQYDMAGYFALLNDERQALENLKRAVDLGWRDVPALKADKLFADLGRWPSLAGLIETLAKPKKNSLQNRREKP